MRALAVALACLLFACERPAEVPPAPAPAEVVRLENDNLLNLVFGASVIDRNYELHFETSAAQAIDGSPLTNWVSAPGGNTMSAVFALAAPSRLTRLGTTVPKNKADAPDSMRFETSLDGRTWRQAVDAKLTFDKEGPQYFDIEPVDARYIRITATNAGDVYSSISSVLAIGRETAPFVQPPIEGCWEIDNVPARFERHGARVFGTIGRGIVDGGSDGRVYRFMWLERNMWGYAAVSVSPDGRHLSGVRWHEEANPLHNGDGWLGTRVPCTSQTQYDGAKVVDYFISRTGKWRLYGVRFDPNDRLLPAESENALALVDRLVREHPQHRFAIVAREYRASSDPKNRERSQKKLEAMRAALQARGTDLTRIQFANAGPERHPLYADFTGGRAMDSGVELQVVPPQ